MGTRTFLAFILGIFYSTMLLAAPTSLTYQGRILKSDSTPLEYNNVSFIFQIIDPSGLCVIYQEQVNGINMVNSKGVFDVPIGNGTVIYPTGGSFTVADSFNNSSTFTCQGGATYSAAVGDVRKLRVQFYDGVGWQTISPDTTVRSVPYAQYSYSAAKLGTNVPSDFILKAIMPTCAAGTFLSYDGTNFSCAAVSGAAGGTVTNVTSTNSYLSVSNGASAPALTVNVGASAGTVAAGDDARIVGALSQSAFNTYVASATCSAGQTMYWNSGTGNFACQSISLTTSGDVTGNLSATKVVALQNNPVDTAAPAVNQVLQWNGTKWSPANLPAGNPGTVTNVTGSAPINVATGTSTPVISITQASSSTNGYLSSADWNTFNGKQTAGNYITALTGDVTASGPGSVAANVAKLQGNTLTITTPANKDYLRFNGTAFVNAPLTAADIPSLDWSKITTGTPTTLAGYNITDGVQNLGGTPSIKSGADASKGAAGTAGRLYVATDTFKIYRDNGTGWDLIGSASGSGGTVTNVTSTNAYLSVATGTSTPALTLNVGTAANTVAAGNDSRFTDARTPTGTAGGDLSGTYPNPSVAKISGTALAIAALSTGQVLKFNGTSWANATDADSLGGLSCANGDVAYFNGTNWSCRNTSTTNSNNSLVLRDGTGSFSSASANLGSLQINNGSGGVATVSVPAAFTSYTLRLPSSVGTAGQMMTSNGTGDMVWSGAVTVSGSQVVGTTKSITTGVTTIDFANGNLQYTPDSCGAFILWNMKSGASYTFAVQGATAATCSFTAFSDSGTTPLTVHLPPDHGPTTANTHTVYTFVALGSHVYASWVTGY